MNTEEIKKNWLFDTSSKYIVTIIGIFGFVSLVLAAHLTGTRTTGLFTWKFVENNGLISTFLEGILSLFLLTILIISISILKNRKIGIIEVMNVILMSRLPFIILTVFNINDYIRIIQIINFSKIEHGLYDLALMEVFILILFIITSLSSIYMTILILWKGLKNNFEWHSWKDKIVFILILIFFQITTMWIFKLVSNSSNMFFT